MGIGRTLPFANSDVIFPWFQRETVDEIHFPPVGMDETL